MVRFCYAALSLLLVSCATAWTSMSVSVDLPDLPACWTGENGATEWELTWVSAEACGGPLRVAPGGSVHVDLPRGSDAVLMARAVFGSYRSLPYGAVWPLEHKRGRIALSAESGYAAAVLELFVRSGSLRPEFNVPKFLAAVKARLTDPWDADPASFAPYIAEKRFRLDHIRPIPKQSCVVEVVHTVLYPDSPWGSVVIPSGDGSVVINPQHNYMRRWICGSAELRALVSGGETLWTISRQPVSGK